MDNRSTSPRSSRAAARLLAVVAGVLLAATVGFYADAAPSGTTGSGCVNKGTCLLHFVNQPNTTHTNSIIKAGFDSTGASIKVEILDPDNGLVVKTTAQVTLTLVHNLSGGTLSGGGPVNASIGVATFASLSVNTAGAYQLRASSPAASNTPDSGQFMVAGSLDTCSGTDCTFTEPQALNSYTLDPVTGSSGATYAAALNIAGLNISCAGSPYNYPDNRQPNAVWFDYEDGTTNSDKVITIKIDKSIVQATAENGASFYRVCFSSPTRFKDRLGQDAPLDSLSNGPTAYFGTPWYTGLLPDCGDVNNVAPCVISWTGTQGGDRIGTFRAPHGDPTYR